MARRQKQARTKKVKSHLQQAADRCNEVNAAIAEWESYLQEAEATYNAALMELRRAGRELDDTKSLLQAQYQKRERELQSVREIIGDGYVTMGVENGCCVTDKPRHF